MQKMFAWRGLLPVVLLATRLHAQVGVSTTSAVLTIGGRQFRDLNRNGVLDPYEDWRLSSAVRAADLVARMTLEEKAGRPCTAPLQSLVARLHRARRMIRRRPRR